MGRLIAISLWLLMAVAAQAQVWAPARSDDGHFIYHTARAGAGLAFACYAPSPQGKTAWEVGAHEVEATAEGQIRLEFALALIPPDGSSAPQRDDLILWVDQTGYRLPLATYSDFYGYWSVPLNWDDGLFTALGGAQVLILAPGSDPLQQLPVTRLGQALAAVQRACAADWAAAKAAPAPASPGRVVIPQQLVNHVTQGCRGPAPLPSSAVQAGDLDGDSAPDFVLDWGGLTCPGTLPRPFCGAANCSQEVFLSSRGYARPIEFLGTSLGIVPHPAGGLALQRGGTFSVCGANNEFCAALVQWDGASFVERP